VLAISVISVSLDSSEESVGTSSGRGILFGTIPTTIPDITPSFDPFEDPSSDHIPPLPATSPFLSSTNDSLDSDIPDTPSSPTHGTPFTNTTPSTQRSLVASGALRHRVMVLAHGQPIPHVDYSSSDHFSSDDSSRDSSSSSSLETSSDSFADALSDSASSRSSFDHSLPAPSSNMRPSHHLCSLVPSFPCSSAAISDRPSHDSSFVSPSHKRSRSLTTYVPLSSPISGALSYVRADLLPSPKRIRSPESAKNLEEEIDECIAYADALRDRGIDARVVVEAEERAVEVMYETLEDLVQRFHDHTEEIPVHQLKRDNRRLRDIIDVVSQELPDLSVGSLRLVPGGIWTTIPRLFLDYPSVDP
ncbi:hypothetical protein Tco_0737925, partial [Tanacetum coccineum]